MARTIFYAATTLDGYLADEHDSLDWLFVQDQDPKGGAFVCVRHSVVGPRRNLMS